MKKISLERLPYVMQLMISLYLERIENCRMALVSQNFYYLTQDSALWNHFLLNDFRTQQRGVAKMLFFHCPAFRKDIFCDRIGKNYVFNRVLTGQYFDVVSKVMRKERSGTFNDTILRLGDKKPSIDEKIALATIQSKTPLRLSLGGPELQGYLILGLLTVEALATLNIWQMKNLRKEVIRGYIASGDLTVAKAIGLNNDDEVMLIGDRFIRSYVASRQLTLCSVLRAGRFTYAGSDQGDFERYDAQEIKVAATSWQFQILINFECDNVRAGIHLGKFTAEQALYFNWEIRRLLNNLNITEMDCSQAAEIIKISEMIRRDLELGQYNETIRNPPEGSVSNSASSLSRYSSSDGFFRDSLPEEKKRRKRKYETKLCETKPQTGI